MDPQKSNATSNRCHFVQKSTRHFSFHVDANLAAPAAPAAAAAAAANAAAFSIDTIDFQLGPGKNSILKNEGDEKKERRSWLLLSRERSTFINPLQPHFFSQILAFECNTF